MAQSHPAAAAYVSADGKVSFDRYGRKLDSGGNVVAGDRQRAGDAGGKPIERKQEQQQQPQAQQQAAQYTFPANATGQPVQRSAWDKSPVAPAQGAAASTVSPRGSNPNVLAPGGIDPATGKPYPTARNGGVAAPSTGSAWRAPWMGQQGQGSIPMQTEGLNVAPSASYGFPAGATGRALSPAEDFMAGNNPYSPVQPKSSIPGFGQLPASIQAPQPVARSPFEVAGLNTPPQPGDGMMYDPYGGNYSGNPLAPRWRP